MPDIAIIGTTSWGMTLGVALARQGTRVTLWARTAAEAKELSSKGPNPVSLPNTRFPSKLAITDSVKKALSGAAAVLLVVPSQAMRQNVKIIAEHIEDSTLIISGAKGLEAGSAKRMSEVIAEEIRPGLKSNICVLSGPNLSQEILAGLPAATVIAAENESVARKAKKLMNIPNLCVFTNSDLIGVELGGAVKNIIALGAGIADGLGYGDNAKAALITRGLTEMTALGVALGANPLTFLGLAGLGDLAATCASSLSRNHFFGTELARGRPAKLIAESMIGVAEGYSTTLVVWQLAQKMELEMPITGTIYRILYESADIKKSASELMSAGAVHELAGRKWKLFSFLRRTRAKA